MLNVENLVKKVTILFVGLFSLAFVLSCDNQAKQKELEKQRQEDSIRVAENVKKELAEKEAKERAEREKQEAAERAEREKQEAEEKERIEQDGFTTSKSGYVFSVKKVINRAYDQGVRGGGMCKRRNDPHFAGHGTEEYFKEDWTNAFGIPNNEKAKEVYNRALQEYLRGYKEGLEF